MLKDFAAFVCHVLWFISCLPGWIAFEWALRHPRRAQERVLRRLIAANRRTSFGRSRGFGQIRSPEEFAARVPLADYDDFSPAIQEVRRGAPFALAAECPVLLEPTSGSSGAPKLVPVTPGLQREIAAAVQPWIAGLYFAHRQLFLGRQYWAVSPNTPAGCDAAEPAGRVRVGFADDADYLGPVGRLLSRGILANPPELRQVTDPDSFVRMTLLFLLRERNLRLVSVWHPSFLTLLLDAIPRHLAAVVDALHTGELPRGLILSDGVRCSLRRRLHADPRRARELAGLDLAAHPERVDRIWPRLAVISCWAGERSEPWLGQLRALFPEAAVQGKGLMATEGCVSVPARTGQYPCAVRSHFLEFVPVGATDAVPVWALEKGGEYSVVLTTGGGLWRYRLHDQVRVVGFCHATPCIEFLAKDNAVSDLVGEKLAERHVGEGLASAAAATGLRPVFAMAVADPKSSGRCGYLLLLEFPPGRCDASQVAAAFAEFVERELCRNFHYVHARNLGQLAELRPCLVVHGLAGYRAAREAAGTRMGTLKVPALEIGTSLPNGWWASVSAATLPISE